MSTTESDFSDLSESESELTTESESESPVESGSKSKTKTKKVDKYEVLEKTELIKFLKAAKSHCYNNIVIDFPISETFFNLLGSDINMFTKASLSKYAPLSAFDKPVMKGKMEWARVSERKDLTTQFIRKNLRKLDLVTVFKHHVLPYKYMHENMENYTIKRSWDWGDEINTIISNILKSKDYQIDQKMLLISTFVQRIKKQVGGLSSHQKNKEEFNDVCKTYLKYIYDQEDVSSLVSLTRFLKMLLPISNLEHSWILYDYFCPEGHSKLDHFEWKYLIDNKVIGYPFPLMHVKIPRNVKRIFIQNLNLFEEVHIDYNDDYHDTEKVIVQMLLNGKNPNKLWSQISEEIPAYQTPYWFLNKYQKDLDWYKLAINMIKSYQEDKIPLDIFLQWFQDHHNKIQINIKGKRNPIGYYYPEVLLYHFGDQQNIFPPQLLKSIIVRQKISVPILEKLAPIFDQNTDQQMWEQISLCQYLTPEFIKKYDSKLDWDKLAYNPTWQLYPQDQFHKLPTFDSKNNMLWMPLDKKIEEIKKICLPKDPNFKIELNGNNIIIKSKLLKKQENPWETYSFCPKNYELNSNDSDKILGRSYDYSMVKYSYYSDFKGDLVCFGPDLVVYDVNNKSSSYQNSGIFFRTGRNSLNQDKKKGIAPKSKKICKKKILT